MPLNKIDEHEVMTAIPPTIVLNDTAVVVVPLSLWKSRGILRQEPTPEAINAFVEQLLNMGNKDAVQHLTLKLFTNPRLACSARLEIQTRRSKQKALDRRVRYDVARSQLKKMADKSQVVRSPATPTTSGGSSLGSPSNSSGASSSNSLPDLGCGSTGIATLPLAEPGTSTEDDGMLPDTEEMERDGDMSEEHDVEVDPDFAREELFLDTLDDDELSNLCKWLAEP
jgi:hypothetical protein